jgi:hypothetical protein
LGSYYHFNLVELAVWDLSDGVGVCRGWWAFGGEIVLLRHLYHHGNLSSGLLKCLPTLVIFLASILIRIPRMGRNNTAPFALLQPLAAVRCADWTELSQSWAIFGSGSPSLLTTNHARLVPPRLSLPFQLLCVLSRKWSTVALEFNRCTWWSTVAQLGSNRQPWNAPYSLLLVNLQ